MSGWWHEGIHAKQISDDLRTAWEELDRAYYQSVTNNDLIDHSTKVIRALERVRRRARDNRVSEAGKRA